MESGFTKTFHLRVMKNKDIFYAKRSMCHGLSAIIELIIFPFNKLHKLFNVTNILIIKNIKLIDLMS